MDLIIFSKEINQIIDLKHIFINILDLTKVGIRYKTNLTFLGDTTSKPSRRLEIDTLHRFHRMHVELYYIGWILNLKLSYGYSETQGG